MSFLGRAGHIPLGRAGVSFGYGAESTIGLLQTVITLAADVEPLTLTSVVAPALVLGSQVSPLDLVSRIEPSD